MNSFIVAVTIERTKTNVRMMIPPRVNFSTHLDSAYRVPDDSSMTIEPGESSLDLSTLLSVMRDSDAHLFERVDAVKAIPDALAQAGNEHATQKATLALIAVASDEDEPEFLQRTAGTALGELWCVSGTYDKKVVKRLSDYAKIAFNAALGERRPELIPDTPERRVCREHLNRLAAIQAGTLLDRPDEDRFSFNGVVDGHPFRLKVKIKSGDIKLAVKLLTSPGEMTLTYSPLPEDESRAADGWKEPPRQHALSPTVKLLEPDAAAIALLARLPEELRDDVARVMDDTGISELRVSERLVLEFLVDIHSYDDPDEELEPDEEAYDLTTNIPPALAMAARLACGLEAIAPPRPLDEVVQCPYCGTRAYLTADLKCPNCGAAVL